MDLKSFRKPFRTSRYSLYWTAPISIIAALLLWWLVARLAGLPAFILPSPEQVAVRFGRHWWMAACSLTLQLP